MSRKGCKTSARNFWINNWYWVTLNDSSGVIRVKKPERKKFGRQKSIHNGPKSTHSGPISLDRGLKSAIV